MSLITPPVSCSLPQPRAVQVGSSDDHPARGGPSSPPSPRPHRRGGWDRAGGSGVASVMNILLSLVLLSINAYETPAWYKKVYEIKKSQCDKNLVGWSMIAMQNTIALLCSTKKHIFFFGAASVHFKLNHVTLCFLLALAHTASIIVCALRRTWITANSLPLLRQDSYCDNSSFSGRSALGGRLSHSRTLDSLHDMTHPHLTKICTPSTMSRLLLWIWVVGTSCKFFMWTKK